MCPADPVACRRSGRLPARTLMTARVGIVTFPGSLDDRDAARAVTRAGGEAVPLWHADRGLGGVDAVILPGALVRNTGLRFIDRRLRVRIEATGTPWTRDYAGGQELTLVLKSGEGAYIADRADLDRLEERGQVVARYCGGSPNGSARDIAGIRNEAGNVVGLMPHPEHAIDPLTGPGRDGLGFFTSVLSQLVAPG